MKGRENNLVRVGCIRWLALNTLAISVHKSARVKTFRQYVHVVLHYGQPTRTQNDTPNTQVHPSHTQEARNKKNASLSPWMLHSGKIVLVQDTNLLESIVSCAKVPDPFEWLAVGVPRFRGRNTLADTLGIPIGNV